jgi:exopolyphosphatase/pppGpp-phosphohydrolase
VTKSAILIAFLIAAVDTLKSDTGKMCVIDMGSNSFKLILGEMSAGTYVQSHVEKETVEVGDDMSKTGRISEEKLRDIQETLTEFKNRCTSKGAVSFSAVATAAFREADNGTVVVEIGKRLQIPVEIASEERESTLAYLTATNGVGNRAVIDNGSRSIELVSKNDLNDVPRWKVVQLGYRIAYQQFFVNATTFAEAYENMGAALTRELGDIQFLAGREDFVGIELDEMAKYVLKKKKVNGARITLALLTKRLNKLRAQDARQFTKLKGVEEIDRVLPRMVALEYILEKTGYQSLVVVEKELGVGLIIEAGLRASSP